MPSGCGFTKATLEQETKVKTNALKKNKYLMLETILINYL